MELRVQRTSEGLPSINIGFEETAQPVLVVAATGLVSVKEMAAVLLDVARMLLDEPDEPDDHIAYEAAHVLFNPKPRGAANG